jgi:D-3-phosphoglycerate dehydrogenase
MDREMKKGSWKKISGQALHEATLGVVGVGNIGKEVLRKASAFGMQLLGNDILAIDPDFLGNNHVDMVPLEDLLSRSDFISLNSDLNPTSYHLINESRFRLMKPNAVLINTSRGPVIEEQALIKALETGQIAGAGLDVYEMEPLPSDSPLLSMDQVLLAPHNSNSSPAAWERVHWNTIRNLLEGLGIDSTDLSRFEKEL